MAGVVLSSESSQIIKSHGLLSFVLLRALAPIFYGLANMFGRMDLKGKVSAGMCKNYTVVAWKPVPSS